MSLSGGMMVLRAMVLGRLDGLFTSIHERVLYPSHRRSGKGPGLIDPALFMPVFPRILTLGIPVNRGNGATHTLGTSPLPTL